MRLWITLHLAFGAALPLATHNAAARPHAHAAASRRNALGATLGALATLAIAPNDPARAALAALAIAPDDPARAFAYQPGLVGKDYGKSKMSYGDFTETPSGLLYKDATLGKGKTPEAGDRVVVEWTGYTIGYFGRPFQTRRLEELDQQQDEFLRWIVGDGSVIPALDEGVRSMAEGGVRQLVVPPGIGYDPADPSHTRVGPRPTTFSGQRALDFVLQNKDLIDKTLLFNIKVIRVDKGGGKRA